MSGFFWSVLGMAMLWGDLISYSGLLGGDVLPLLNRNVNVVLLHCLVTAPLTFYVFSKIHK